MSKKVAVLAVNPVNGFGLFQYLETFFENNISFKTFAVAENKDIRTNSGLKIQTDTVIADLKGKENEFDAVVFSCGDAMPKFSENVDKPYNQDMLAVLNAFNEQNKILIGHCAAALVFDSLGIGTGKRVALHPLIKNFVKNVIATDEKSIVDGNIYTAQTECTLHYLMPEIIEALK